MITMPPVVVERIKAHVLADVAEAKRIIAIGRSENGQPFTVVSDPAFVRWQAEGAPSVQCGGYAPFTEPDEPAPDCFECGRMIEGWAHQDDDGHYYCDDCCPVCDDADYESEWCTCLDTVPSGECPHCQKPVLPF